MAGLADLAIIGQSVGPARREPSPYRHSRCTPPSARFDGGWGAVRLMVSLLPTCGKRRVYDRDQNPYPYGRRDRVFDCTVLSFSFFFFTFNLHTVSTILSDSSKSGDESMCCSDLYSSDIHKYQEQSQRRTDRDAAKEYISFSLLSILDRIKTVCFRTFLHISCWKTTGSRSGGRKSQAKPSHCTAIHPRARACVRQDTRLM